MAEGNKNHHRKSNGFIAYNGNSIVLVIMGIVLMEIIMVDRNVLGSVGGKYLTDANQNNIES